MQSQREDKVLEHLIERACEEGMLPFIVKKTLHTESRERT
jgi:hypothetical protein